MTNPPTGVASTLASLLSTGEKLPVRDAIQLVRTLAAEIADLHARGRLQRGVIPELVGLDSERNPVLRIVNDFGSEISPADVREYLPPELGQLPFSELPVEIEAAQRKLREFGITLDPRQIDIYSLGAILCRMLTGQSAAAYLRSPRVKRDVPHGLHPSLERAFGSDGRQRFVDMVEFSQALDEALAATPKTPQELPQIDPNSHESDPASIHTGDTTPSFVKSADTSTWVQAVPSPNPSDQALPFVRLGHYDIVGRLGRGGMGDVYEGYEQGLDRKVAIKVLPAELARQSDFVRRFKAEATAAAKLVHPNIIQIYFIGEDAGHHFFAMQYVSGESVADLLHRRGRIGVEETLAIVEQALAGLAAAHKLGLVHRDIKPGNILLDRQHRRALLADFGLVKSVETSGTGYTATGVIMGTVDYISPEQGRGQTVDGRSDLYSFGVLMFHVLSGKLPFSANSPTALIFQHVYETPPSLTRLAPDVSASLAAIIAKLMCKLPADRHQTVDALMADLRACRQGQPLPSGADRQPLPVSRSTGTNSSVVYASSRVLSDPPAVAYEPSDVKVPRLWERAQLRAKSLFWRHAPEIIQRLQNTQQQMDAAVARYARNERELRQLAEEAEEVLHDLTAQAKEHRSVAKQAEQQASQQSGATAIHSSDAAALAAEQTANDLERHAAEQQEQLDAIKLRLAQIVAKRQKLQNQRDILNARLKMAGVRVAVESGKIKRRSKSQVVFVVGGLLLVLLMFRNYIPINNWISSGDTPEMLVAVPKPTTTEHLKSKANRPSIVPPPELLSIPRNRIQLGQPASAISFEPTTGRLAIVGEQAIFYRSSESGEWQGQDTRPVVDGQLKMLAVSPNWKTIAANFRQSISDDSGYRIALLDLQSGEVVQSSNKFDGPVKSLMISQNSSYVAALQPAQKDSSRLVVWEAKDLTRQVELQDVSSNVLVARFDPQGHWITSGSADGTIQIHQLPSGKLLNTLKRHTSSISALAVAPNGESLVSGDALGHLLLWDTESGQNLGTFTAHENAITSIEIAPKGVHLASSDENCTLLWDMSVGVVRSVLSTQGPTKLAFDSTGNSLATFEDNSRTARVWNGDASSTPFIGSSSTTDYAEIPGVPSITDAAPINSTQYAVASGKKLLLFDLGLNTTIPRFSEHESAVRAVSVFNDRSTIITGDQDGSIQFWDSSDGHLISKTTTAVSASGRTDSIRQLTVNRDDSFVAVATDHNLYVLASDKPADLVLVQTPLDSITALAWEPRLNRDLLIAGNNLKTGTTQIVLSELSRTRFRVIADLPEGSIDWLSFISDKSQVISVTGGTVRVLRADTGKIIHEWKVPNASRTAIALSPSERQLAMATQNGIEIWGVESGRELARFGNSSVSKSLVSLRYSDDGQTLLTTAANSILRSYSLTVNLQSDNNLLDIKALNLNEQIVSPNWGHSAQTLVGRESLAQFLELERDPQVRLNGPANDPDLVNFSTDGGWWLNEFRLIRRPGTKRALLELGRGTDLNLELSSPLFNTGRLFLIIGWDGKQGYCLSKEDYKYGANWVLSEIPGGTSMRISVPDAIRLANTETTYLQVQVNNCDLTLRLRAGQTGEPFDLRPVKLLHNKGKLLLGIVDGQPGNEPFRINIGKLAISKK